MGKDTWTRIRRLLSRAIRFGRTARDPRQLSRAWHNVMSFGDSFSATHRLAMALPPLTH